MLGIIPTQSPGSTQEGPTAQDNRLNEIITVFIHRFHHDVTRKKRHTRVRSGRKALGRGGEGGGTWVEGEGGGWNCLASYRNLFETHPGGPRWDVLPPDPKDKMLVEGQALLQTSSQAALSNSTTWSLSSQMSWRSLSLRHYRMNDVAR